jgi:actin-like ATPase involved in cell morphogenesis
VGGNDIDAAIATLLRLELGVVVSPALLEALKISLGSATGRTDAARETVAARTVSRANPWRLRSRLISSTGR